MPFHNACYELQFSKYTSAQIPGTIRSVTVCDADVLRGGLQASSTKAIDYGPIGPDATFNGHTSPGPNPVTSAHGFLVMSGEVGPEVTPVSGACDVHKQGENGLWYVQIGGKAYVTGQDTGEEEGTYAHEKRAFVHYGPRNTTSMNVNVRIPRGRARPNPSINLPVNVLSAASSDITAPIRGFDGVLYYTTGPYTSPLNLIKVADLKNDPRSENGLDRTKVTNDLLREIQLSGTNHKLPDGTQIREAGYTGIDSQGVIYIRESDLGNGANLIPTENINNTPSTFENHPSVFVRRCRYVKGVAEKAIDHLPINNEAGSQPLRIQVLKEQKYSDWLFAIDGNIQTVRIHHDEADDVRTPREIYNAYIAPAIRGSSATYKAAKFSTVDDLHYRKGGGPLFPNSDNRKKIYDPSTGNISIASLQFLEYARFLRPQNYVLRLYNGRDGGMFRQTVGEDFVPG